MRLHHSLLALSLVVCACAAEPVRRYPMQAPLWNDPDRNNVTRRPAEYYSGLVADGADQIAFRPLSKALSVPLADEATNVNSLDEVPNSAWFTNRIGAHDMSPEEVRQGACASGPTLDPARGPWLVTAAKPDGANPGFFVKAPDGTRYLLKFDGPIQPERATSADVIGSKLYHAFGYHTPCNEIVYFKREQLAISPKATRKNPYGETVPITNADVDLVLSKAIVTKEGLLRASASRFVPGKPLGPFRYEGTRSDDPNDVVPHDQRRELRGGRLFAAWLNHFDSREQNSLDVWVEEGGRSYVRHYQLDWGDSLGSAWASDKVNRRFGHTGYLDVDYVFTDLVTLGTLDRPWNHAQRGREPDVFGYFDEHDFVPSRWRGGYPNPAFERMSERDALWAARILARISDADVRAAVASAQLPAARAEALSLTLIGRRDRILQEYLTRNSPLTRFSIARRTTETDQSLCFEDDALRARVSDAHATRYQVRVLGGEKLDRVMETAELRPDPAQPQRSCLVLPAQGRPAQLAGAGARDDDPRRYGVAEIATAGLASRSLVRVHLYDLGAARGYQLVGIERTGAE
jgi:hypothetical protein